MVPSRYPKYKDTCKMHFRYGLLPFYLSPELVLFDDCSIPIEILFPKCFDPLPNFKGSGFTFGHCCLAAAVDTSLQSFPWLKSQGTPQPKGHNLLHIILSYHIVKLGNLGEGFHPLKQKTRMNMWHWQSLSQQHAMLDRALICKLHHPLTLFL